MPSKTSISSINDFVVRFANVNGSGSASANELFARAVLRMGVPLSAICNREYTDPRQRQLFKNIIYVGALSALLDMDIAAIEQLIGEQFKGKEKLFDANKNALHLGRDWVLMNL